MIKNLMEFIKKWSKVILFFIVLSILIFTLIKSIKYDNTSPSEKGTFNFLSRISTFGDNIRHKISGNTSPSEVDKLKSEISSLRNELIKNNMQQKDIVELKELKKSLKFVNDTTSSSFVSAEIIAKNNGAYYKSFTLSAGSANGVKNDSIVVNGNGIVGRVYQVAKNYSKAISIMDNKTPISFQIMGRKTDTGMLSQDIAINHSDTENLIKGYMFDANSPVKVGEIVTTSGLGLYPVGIPIGTVSKVIPDNQNILKYVIVLPYVDFKDLNKVIIFNKKNIQ